MAKVTPHADTIVVSKENVTTEADRALGSLNAILTLSNLTLDEETKTLYLKGKEFAALCYAEEERARDRLINQIANAYALGRKLFEMSSGDRNMLYATHGLAAPTEGQNKWLPVIRMYFGRFDGDKTINLPVIGKYPKFIRNPSQDKNAAVLAYLDRNNVEVKKAAGFIRDFKETDSNDKAYPKGLVGIRKAERDINNPSLTDRKIKRADALQSKAKTLPAKPIGSLTSDTLVVVYGMKVEGEFRILGELSQAMSMALKAVEATNARLPEEKKQPPLTVLEGGPEAAEATPEEAV
ncbi:hypothetical protein HLH26_05555 [Gluconacetobacter sp. 1b LMG 1731]|uniref:Uncharacterized protein n=1 Tax=Gluconacetobacter dulcium TaxID=2729096 RepID=A0A7W4NRW7_9PROT|nr:hypothetical protein [Gluconacetobacter dulcium]MBB2164009.1 hypothetical protein [Gluconacetobacter dulcium]MBB2192713.1 hypothetical protein [Gluconacetobacter dulcium]